MLDTMRRAGRPCPVITLLGPDEIAPSRIRAVSPETTIILRVWRPGDDSLDLSARQYFERYIDPYPERASVRYHQISNEVVRFDPGAITFWIANMSWTQNHGPYRLAVPTWPTGTPDLSLWQRADILDMLRFIRNNGHILALHEYYRGDLDWELGRFLHHVLPTLPEDLRNNMPRVAFTEWGQQGGATIGREAWKTFLSSGQRELSKYPFVIGGATWAVGDTGNVEWLGDNWASKMDVLAEL